MGEPESGDVGGAEENRRTIELPEMEDMQATFRRGHVSATIDWTHTLFVFRFRDERPEVRRVLGAPKEYEFSWTPTLGVNVKEPPHGQA